MRYAVVSSCMARVSGSGAAAGCRCSSIGKSVRSESIHGSSLSTCIRSQKADPWGAHIVWIQLMFVGRALQSVLDFYFVANYEAFGAPFGFQITHAFCSPAQILQYRFENCTVLLQEVERSVCSKVLCCLSAPPWDCEWYGVPVTCRTPNAAQNALNRVRYAGPLSV
eukprot:scaffold349_cov542-Pavlova_lutheri.AAC.1